MLPFTTRLINHLISLGGSGNLGRKWFNEVIRSHHAKAAVRLRVLERAKLLLLEKLMPLRNLDALLASGVRLLYYIGLIY